MERNISLETLEKTIVALDIAPIEQFHELEFENGRTTKKDALDAINSLLAGRTELDLLTLLRVMKEIVAAVDAAKK